MDEYILQNYTMVLDDSNQPIIITMKENYSTLGILISSCLLSAGAFIVVVLGQIQKSKCKKITGCCGVDCIREVEP